MLVVLGRGNKRERELAHLQSVAVANLDKVVVTERIVA